MKVTTDHWIWQNTLTTELCQHLIKGYFTKEEAKEALIGGELAPDVVAPEIRVTNICWIPADDFISVVLMNFALRANNKAGWNFDVDSIEPVQLAEYLPGGHYTWHTDTAVTEVNELNTQRKLSVVALLSSPDDYEGGGLELNRENASVMPNGQGSVYVFPSILEHRVLPVTSGVRYSLAGWCRGPAFR